MNKFLVLCLMVFIFLTNSCEPDEDNWDIYRQDELILSRPSNGEFLKYFRGNSSSYTFEEDSYQIFNSYDLQVKNGDVFRCEFKDDKSTIPWTDYNATLNIIIDSIIVKTQTSLITIDSEPFYIEYVIE